MAAGWVCSWNSKGGQDGWCQVDKSKAHEPGGEGRKKLPARLGWIPPVIMTLAVIPQKGEPVMVSIKRVT